MRHQFDPNDSNVTATAKFALGVVIVAGILIAISTLVAVF